MQYPASVVWKIELAAGVSIDRLFGHDRAKRVRKAGIILRDSGYRVDVATVTPEYLERFIPRYQEQIATKLNGVVFDVEGHFVQGWRRGRSYEAISLWRGEELLGGLLYCIGPTTLSVAYRTFPHVLPVKLPIACSFVAERVLIERALELGRQAVWHGRDRNVYGVHSAIGVAMYKCTVGCLPYVSRAKTNTWQAVAALAPERDTLVFLAEPGQSAITEGLLYTTISAVEARQKYGVLLNHPTLRVTVRPYGGTSIKY